MNINRRKFIAQSSLFSTFAISGTKSSGKIIGANDRINVAVCGIKGRGTSHMGGHGRQKNVVISHLVDPDSRLHDARKKFIISKFKNSPSCVQDVRNVLDNKDVDVISIATPNHWHSLMSIWACQAGKDVYVEKPLSHNLFEGKMVSGHHQLEWVPANISSGIYFVSFESRGMIFNKKVTLLK